MKSPRRKSWLFLLYGSCLHVWPLAHGKQLADFTGVIIHELQLEGVRTDAVPSPRRNQNNSRPNAYDKARVELCRSTCVLIANGKSSGAIKDDGAVTYDPGRGGID